MGEYQKFHTSYTCTDSALSDGKHTQPQEITTVLTKSDTDILFSGTCVTVESGSIGTGDNALITEAKNYIMWHFWSEIRQTATREVSH